MWLRVGVDYGWLQGKRIGLVTRHVADWIIDRAIRVILWEIPRRSIDHLRRCDLKLHHIGLFVQHRIILTTLTRRREGVRVSAVLIDLRPLRLVTHK